ncbi:YtxH domain-containing protein [Flavobacterium acetivorans]|uniref:YtxH domain-containing protein n=1 Tax=Flavobacterium acetivorans TaxID=2893883 RepID=UPI001E633C9D|nr:YtxH domain-containing protein [Flavobacterium sp. F-29]UFH34613.1 YtxH domain-containing protein [Flavobacterium sp. F-29]
MKTDKVILGVIGGLAAGALMGILFAPAKGTKTRKKIKRKSNEYADEIKEKFDSTIDTISNKYDTLKQEGLNLLNDGKSKFEKTRKEIENLEV